MMPKLLTPDQKEIRMNICADILQNTENGGKERLKDTYVNGMLNLYVMNFILFMMMAPITVTLTRFAMYYDVLVVFVIPILYDYLKLRTNRLILSLIITAYLIYRFFYGALNGVYADLFVPYNTIFTKEIPMVLF